MKHLACILAIACTACPSKNIRGDAHEDPAVETPEEPLTDPASDPSLEYLLDVEDDTFTDVTAEPACEDAYPAGPYGTGAGDTIENLTFWSVDGSALSFHDFYCDPETKLLLVYGATGWCELCPAETIDLNGLYAEYHLSGLEVLLALYEMDPGGTAIARWVVDYHAYYEVTYPTVADIPRQVTAYFDSASPPLNMFVDLNTMEILEIQTGYEAGALRADIESYLASID